MCNARLAGEVRGLSRSLERIEHDLEFIGNGDADDRGLHATVHRNGGLDRVPMAPQEGQ